MPRPADLPDYERPPIDEVVIGVQFLPLTGFSEVHVGLYWREIQGDFPASESHPRIETPIEDLAQLGGPPRISVAQATGSQSRTWLKSANDELVLQIQSDHFIHNWRRRDNAYPRFERVLATFMERLVQFRSVLETQGIAAPDVRQIELSYINWVDDMPSTDFFLPAAAAAVVIDGLDIRPDMTFAARYLARDSAAHPIGRLFAQCTPAVRMEPSGGGQRGTQLQFTFKAPSETALEDTEIQSLAEYGRQVIVKGFTALTTDEAQRKWGRLQ